MRGCVEQIRRRLDIDRCFAILQNMQANRLKRSRSPREYEAGAGVFKALGHPSRLLMIDELTRGERCVADLTALVGDDISAVSNHLSVLRNAGLIEADRRGQQVFYALEAPCIGNVFQWLDELRAAKAKLR